MDLSIACADVGSVAKGNFGWAICDPPTRMLEAPDHGSIQALADQVARRLHLGRSVALGFECPLFVPVREEPSRLTAGRRGEGNRSWSAGAGCGSLATGLVEAVWLLHAIRRKVPVEPAVFLDWNAFVRHPGSLFLWEALVSREAKAGTHHGDAALAVTAFVNALPAPDRASIIAEDDVLSLIGAALLRTGWSVPTSILATPCVVIAA